MGQLEMPHPVEVTLPATWLAIREEPSGTEAWFEHDSGNLLDTCEDKWSRENGRGRSVLLSPKLLKRALVYVKKQSATLALVTNELFRGSTLPLQGILPILRPD